MKAKGHARFIHTHFTDLPGSKFDSSSEPQYTCSAPRHHHPISNLIMEEKDQNIVQTTEQLYTNAQIYSLSLSLSQTHTHTLTCSSVFICSCVCASMALLVIVSESLPFISPLAFLFLSWGWCTALLIRCIGTNRPYFGLQVKYLIPPQEPSFFPIGSSSSTPAH